MGFQVSSLWQYWDLYMFLTAFFVLSSYAFILSDVLAKLELDKLIALQLVMVMVFWLVWGGYSTDAWQYLSGFDYNPFFADYVVYEYLFWTIGHLINLLVEDPWPLKILSAIAGAVICCGAIRLVIINEISRKQLILALVLVMIVPGLILSTGNVIRQGLAGSLVIIGMILASSGHRVSGLALMLVSPLFHTMAIVLLFAVAAGRYLAKFGVLFLVGMLVLGFLFWDIVGRYYPPLLEYIPYQDLVSGPLYIVKLFISTAFAVWLNHFRKKVSVPYVMGRLISTYTFMVGIACFFSVFENVCERLLLFSDLLLPILLAWSVLKWNPFGERMTQYGFGVLCVLALAIWMHPSVLFSLGYVG